MFFICAVFPHYSVIWPCLVTLIHTMSMKKIACFGTFLWINSFVRFSISIWAR